MCALYYVTLAVGLIISFSLSHIILEVEGQRNNNNVNSGNNYVPDTITNISGDGLISSLIPMPQSSPLAENVTSSMNTSMNTKETQPTAAIEGQVSNNNEISAPPYVLAGFWELNIDNGTINYFDANFSMVHVNGLGYHTHQITNFKPNVVMPIVFDPKTGGLSFTGMMDIKEDGRVKWIGVQTRVLINNFNTIVIYPDTDYIDNHFQNQPIYGVVQTLKDEKQDVLLVENLF